MSDSMPDKNPAETREWLDAMRSVIEEMGAERAQYLLRRLEDYASGQGLEAAGGGIHTPYLNSIEPQQQPPMPGDADVEQRLRAWIRWNAMAMVARTNMDDDSLGGHLSSYASSAVLYEVGFNHFFRGFEGHGGDLIFYQGHSSPGLYARSFLEGRLSEEQLRLFRREVGGRGISSYPHPWLMPDYWQFPTVSMGLGPLQAIYMARFLHYQHRRGLADNGDRKVWAFLGDGECHEPESLGVLELASRERLDNLIFVVNCNLQRLDGLVHGNGKIIQDLEGIFRGAGWEVIKVVWGSGWDALLAADDQGLLARRMMEACDGDYQNCKNNGGAYIREHFFGAHPALLKMVEHLSDEDIDALQRGGHDPAKVYAAYHRAVRAGRPVAVLAKTIKGYSMGQAASANIAHSVKKLDAESLRAFRDQFRLPVEDGQLEQLPFIKPPEDSPEMRYLRERRAALHGPLPARPRPRAAPLKAPPLSAFRAQLDGSGERAISSTMALVRILATLAKDSALGPQLVPIIPDEARTFGMEGMFRQLGIYSPRGQLYKPHDAGQIMSYREAEDGQILEEGINEAGAFASWMAAATSYSHSDVPMVPFYIFYSMFGFQRIGDLAWAAGDAQARGFLIGGTAGRTTLNGEGLQHQDGHSHLLASVIPNCRSYDPAYAFELAVIIRQGLRCMMEDGENCFYYITTMNENYQHPPMPEGAEEGIIRGLYRLQAASGGERRVRLLGSGAILGEVRAAAELLAADWQVAAEVWSLTSVGQLYREAVDAERWNLLHPGEAPRRPHITATLAEEPCPVVVATDYLRSHPEQLRAFVPCSYSVLGTDGFGRSDTRQQLRRHFEVDRHHIALQALRALADEGAVDGAAVEQAIGKYAIDPDKPNPLLA